MDRSTLIRFDVALPVDAPPRADVYGAVHKGLRLFMFDTLGRIGACDAADAWQLDETVAQARSLLSILRSHLSHENAFVHAALEARRPGASAPTADDHAGHEAAIAALEAELDALPALDAGRRARALYRLYLRFARFVAENLEHMELEETHVTALLHDAYDDAEIGAMIQRLVATIPPADSAVFHRWMFAGLSHDERVGLLSAIRAHAPEPVWRDEVARARDVLAVRDWCKLADALGVPGGASLIELG